jgi:hypothetical protein
MRSARFYVLVRAQGPHGWQRRCRGDMPDNPSAQVLHDDRWEAGLYREFLHKGPGAVVHGRLPPARGASGAAPLALPDGHAT